MESPFMMLGHAALAGVVLFAVMAFALKQPQEVAITRSILLSLVIAAYMLAFGHQFPPKDLNPALRLN